MKLASNNKLRIIEEDVYLTMGFPRGSKPVEEAKKMTRESISRYLMSGRISGEVCCLKHFKFLHI